MNSAKLLFWVLIPAFAFGGLKVTAQLRPRLESRYGYSRLPNGDTDPAVFISQRSRLELLSTQSDFDLVFAFQDVRVWGDEDLYNSTAVYGKSASIDLYAAYARIKAGAGHSIQIGRQPVNIDDQRLVSERNWNQKAVAYDAVIITDTDNYLAGITWNSDEEKSLGNFYDNQKMKILSFINFKHAYDTGISFSLLALASGFYGAVHKNSLYMKSTVGVSLKYQNNSNFIAINVINQNGMHRSGQKTDAWFYGIKAGNSFAELGAERLSGQDGSSRYTVFDVLYGARHGYYGTLDYFNTTPARGLRDYYLKTDLGRFFLSGLRLDYHYFTLDRIYSQAHDSRFLAHEVDFSYRTNLTEAIAFSGGYSFISASSLLKILQSDPGGLDRLGHWAWCMVTITSEIFNSN